MAGPLSSSFAAWFWCSRRALERGAAAAVLALCHLMLDNVARSKNKKWKNIQTEETRHNFTSWAEQPPSLFLAQLYPLSQKRHVSLLGFYHLPCLSTVSFNPCFPSKAYVVTLLLQVLWWNNCSSLPPQPFRVTRVFAREKHKIIPSLFGEAEKRAVVGAYLITSLLKCKHLVSVWYFAS